MRAGSRPSPSPRRDRFAAQSTPGRPLPPHPPPPAQLVFICSKSLPHFPAAIIEYFVPDLTFTEPAAPGIQAPFIFCQQTFGFTSLGANGFRCLKKVIAVNEGKGGKKEKKKKKKERERRKGRRKGRRSGRGLPARAQRSQPAAPSRRPPLPPAPSSPCPAPAPPPSGPGEARRSPPPRPPPTSARSRATASRAQSSGRVFQICKRGAGRAGGERGSRGDTAATAKLPAGRAAPHHAAGWRNRRRTRSCTAAFSGSLSKGRGSLPLAPTRQPAAPPPARPPPRARPLLGPPAATAPRGLGAGRGGMAAPWRAKWASSQNRVSGPSLDRPELRCRLLRRDTGRSTVVM